jgi:hypothetical protein
MGMTVMFTIPLIYTDCYAIGAHQHMQRYIYCSPNTSNEIWTSTRFKVKYN